jgi:hypothetical protein
MAKKNKRTSAPPAAGMNPAMSMAGGAPIGSTMGTGPVMTGGKKGKKGRAGAAAADPAMTLSPEQMTQLQLEEAIKESQNPSMRLKKLRSPWSVRSCLLNLLFLVILTLAVVFILAWTLPGYKVDKFHFGVLWMNMFEEFGIVGFFNRIGEYFANCNAEQPAAELFMRF